ncbi:MAG: hypothetical protein R3E52_09940 [Burkholderiaceae bacterium]
MSELEAKLPGAVKNKQGLALIMVCASEAGAARWPQRSVGHEKAEVLAGGTVAGARLHPPISSAPEPRERRHAPPSPSTPRAPPLPHPPSSCWPRAASDYEEIRVDLQPEQRLRMMARQLAAPCRRFIGATHVGGCDDLMALDAAGGSAGLLSA